MKRLLLILGLSLAVAGVSACDGGGGAKGSDKAKAPAGSEKKAEGGDKKAEGGDKKAPAAEKKAEGGDKKAEGGEKKAEGDKGGEQPLAKADGKGGLVVQSELYKIKFTVPEGWKVNKGPTGITTVSPDDKLVVLIAGSKSQDVLEASLRDLKANVSFKDVKVEKQGATVVNGLAGIRGEGDVTIIDGDKELPVHFLAFLAKVDDKSVTALIYADKATYDGNVEKIEGILDTIEKM